MSKLFERLDKAKKELEPLVKRCNYWSWKYFTETDTITKFIHPMLSALGWDILNFNEMREEVACGESSMNHVDIVLYLKEPNAYALAPTHTVIEVKSLSYGSIGDEAKASFNYLKDELLKKASYFDSKYAVLTRFAETLVFDTETGGKEAYLKHNEYLDKIDVLWKFLSKPEEI